MSPQHLCRSSLLSRLPLLLLPLLVLPAFLLGGCAEAPGSTIRDVTRPDTLSVEDLPWEVRATVLDRRGLSSITLHWRIDGADQEEEDSSGTLSLRRVEGDIFGATLPEFPVGVRVRWWIEVLPQRGAATVAPAGAPERTFRFRVVEYDDGSFEDACRGGECPRGEVCLPRGECVPRTGCTSSDECPVGQVCTEERCRTPRDVPGADCQLSAQCPDGFTCRFGECVPEQCFVDNDCAAGQRCVFGECFGEDSPLPESCERNADCPGDDQCVTGLCVPRQCRSSAECGEDQSCIRGFCAPIDLPFPLPECQRDRDCPPFGNLRCVLGLCLPPDVVPIPLPDSCEDLRDCPPGQTCLARLCVDAQCERASDCGGGQDCVFGRCVPDAGADASLCESDADCTTPEVCEAGLCAPPGGTGPTPTCETDADCAPGESCTFGLCLPFALPF